MMNPQFNSQSRRTSIPPALMLLPGLHGDFVEIDASKITMLDYTEMTDKKYKPTGIWRITIYLGEKYCYAKMDVDVFRAMLKKAREGVDVDYRDFPQTADKPLRSLKTQKPDGA